MTVTMFDQMFFEFDCPGPECGYSIKEVLSNFVNVDRFPCPDCGFSINLQSADLKGRLAERVNIATQIDEKARKRGEVVKRF